VTNQSAARRPGIVRRTYRAALWRVRNRLLLTSFLFGVVPLVLITVLLSQGVQIVLGQFASAVVRQAIDHAELTGRLSQQLYENTPGEKYATLFCSLYDDRTGRLAYTNAGHLPPLLIREARTVPFETSGMVVGLLPMFSYEQQIVQLQDGDLLAIFSDGVTEAENAAGEQFEATRLGDLLQQHSQLPLDDLIKMVTEQLTRWIHHPDTRDDITIVLARKRAAPE